MIDTMVDAMIGAMSDSMVVAMAVLTQWLMEWLMRWLMRWLRIPARKYNVLLHPDIPNTSTISHPVVSMTPTDVTKRCGQEGDFWVVWFLSLRATRPGENPNSPQSLGFIRFVAYRHGIVSYTAPTKQNTPRLSEEQSHSRWY